MTEPVGRGDLLARIEEGLGRRTVVLLWGPPGIGKTTVVWAALERLRAAGRPTAYVEAHPGEDLGSLLQRLAAELGLRLDVPAIGLFFDALEARGAVAAVDGVEALAERDVRDLVRRAQQTMRAGRLLVATRRIPRLGREMLDLEALEVELLEPATVASLLTAAGVTEADPSAWPGHPLLIKLGLSLGAAPTRHPRETLDHVVRSLVKETLEGLSPAERAALSLVCVARHPWKRALLAELVGAESLADLERRGVLATRAGRCHLHGLFHGLSLAEPPRDLARRAAERLFADARSDPAAGVVAADLWQRAGRDGDAMRALHKIAAIARVHGLRADFLRVLGTLRLRGRWREVARFDEARVLVFSQATTADPRVFLRLTRSRNREVATLAAVEVARIFLHEARFEEAKRWSSVRVVRDPDAAWLARAVRFWANRELGEVDEAQRLQARMLEEAKTPFERAKTILLSLHLHVLCGRPRAVLADFRRACRSTELAAGYLASGPIPAVAMALVQMGRSRSAIPLLERSEAVHRAQASILVVGCAVPRIRALFALGRIADAFAAVEQAQTTPGLTANLRQELLGLRASTLFETGDLDGAESTMRTWESMPADIEGRLHFATVRAAVLCARGEPEACLAALDAALEGPLGHVEHLCALLALERAAALLDLDRPDEAIAVLEPAAALFASHGLRPSLGRAARSRAAAEVALGRLEPAERSVALALRIARAAGAPRAIGDALRTAAAVDRAAGRHAEAEHRLVDAIEVARRIGDRFGLAEAWADRAALAIDHDVVVALAHLREARSLLAGVGATRLDARLRRLSAVAEIRRGNREGARVHVRALASSDPWRTRLELASTVADGRDVRPALRALAQAWRRVPPSRCEAVLREAAALGLPSAGTCRMRTNEGAREAAREEAAWRAAREDVAVVLDLDAGACRNRGRAIPQVVRSKVLSALLGTILERAPDPVRGGALFDAVWGPPDRHAGYEALLRVTISRLRRLLGSTRTLVFVDGGYTIDPSAKYLLISRS